MKTNLNIIGINGIEFDYFKRSNFNIHMLRYCSVIYQLYNTFSESTDRHSL